MARQDGNSPTRPAISAPTSYPSAPSRRGHGKAYLWWRQLKRLQRLLRLRLLCSWYIWRNAHNSCRGHIRKQSPRELPFVDYGPCLESDDSGWYQPNKRTNARKRYTQMLSAIHPWLDMVDRQMFLMGFDAGEQWSLCTMGNGLCKRHQDVDKDSWLALAEKEFGHVPVLVDKWVKKTTPEQSIGDLSSQPPLRESLLAFGEHDRSCKTQHTA